MPAKGAAAAAAAALVQGILNWRLSLAVRRSELCSEAGLLCFAGAVQLRAMHYLSAGANNDQAAK